MKLSDGAADCKSNYITLDKTGGEKTKAVVCFLVAPDMRGQGIATKLLEHVCEDAKTYGYNFIEGYPPNGNPDIYAAHHGTVGLFEKCGFDQVKQTESGCVMRKWLDKDV